MTADTRKSLIETLKGATKEQWSKLASGAIQHFDSWQNTVTGFGTTSDKTTYSQYVGSLPINDQQLSNLYHGDDLAARMVDVVPDEMLREGFNLDLEDAELTAQVAEHLDNLRIDSTLADGWRWGRLFGGSAILLGSDDGRPASSPLVPERAKSLSYLYTLDRRYLWPLTYYTDRGNPKLGRPETYMVSAVSQHDETQGFAVVHESRLVLFGGASTGIREREQNNSWDYSVLHRAVDVLRSFNTGWKAVEILLTDANQAVFKMQGMAEMISAEGQEAFKRRMQLVDMCRSVMRAMVVDGGGKIGNRDTPAEEFLRHSVSFDSIPQTLDKFMLRLSAAVQIPVTILMGQSPAGMNATGDSDFRWFYDRIKSEQTRKLAPIIRRIVKVALASKQFNRPDVPVTVKFPPLWTEAPLAAAQTKLALIQGDAARIASGELLPEEVALTRAKIDGFDNDIILDDNARKVRESVLKDELKHLGDPEPAPAFGGSPFGKPARRTVASEEEEPVEDGAPPPLAKLDSDDQPRDDQGRFGEGSGSSGGSGGGSGGESKQARVAEVTAKAKSEIAQDREADRLNADRARGYAETAQPVIEAKLKEIESRMAELEKSAPSPEEDFDAALAAQREIVNLDRQRQSVAEDKRDLVKALKKEAKDCERNSRKLEKAEQHVEAGRYEEASDVLDTTERNYETADYYEETYLGRSGSGEDHYAYGEARDDLAGLAEELQRGSDDDDE